MKKEEKENSIKTFMPGYWNGEPTAIYTCLLYEVTKSQNKNHWQNMFVGKHRQAVEITQGDQTWLMDNEHGDGFFKVTKGMGSPNCGHKDIENPVIIKYLPTAEWHTAYNREALKNESLEHDEWMKINSPKLYKTVVFLRSMIDKRK